MGRALAQQAKSTLATEGAGGAFSRMTAPPIVLDALRSPGQPLDPHVRAFMEPRFGRDFSQVTSRADAVRPMPSRLAIGMVNDRFEKEADRAAQHIVSSSTAAPMVDNIRGFGGVRIHADGLATESARAIGARAYTVGHHIVFGTGAYAPQTGEGRRLLAHELTHVVQQRATGVSVVQRSLGPVLDRVESLLSYGITDWAITDSEAMEALSLLGTIPPTNLASELQRLGSKYVTRLLDNLPDAAKTGGIYERVIAALGPAGVAPYAKEQLSYGLLDWAITDTEVTRVFNTFVNLPAAAQEQFLTDLNASGRLGRLIDNANSGHHALYIRPWIATLPKGSLSQRQRPLLRTIVLETTDDALETLKLAAETRFDVAVGKSTIPGRSPVEWDPGRLRQTYLILDRLPDAHVAQNKELLRLGQFRQPGTPIDTPAGPGTTTVAGTYSSTARELAVNTEDSQDFAGTIIHETAHAVDREMGWSAGPEPAQPKRGGWKTYGADHNTCADEMTDDSGGAIKTTLTAPQRADVVNEMANAMGNRSAQGLPGRINNLPWFAGLQPPNKNAVLGDRALTALEVGLKTPWFTASAGGEHLGDHVYQESYSPDWVRYRHEARARIVSPYQFRNPGEWFAEVYKLYYRPGQNHKGELLDKSDHDTKIYFDADVDTRAPSR